MGRLHVQTQPKVGPTELGLTLGRLNRLRQNQDGAVHKRPEYAQCQIVQLHESNENGITLCLQHAFDNTHNTKYGSQVCRFAPNFVQNSDLLSIAIEGNCLFKLLDRGSDVAFENKGAKQNGTMVDWDLVDSIFSSSIDLVLRPPLWDRFVSWAPGAGLLLI